MKKYLYGTFCLLIFIAFFSCTEDKFLVKSPDGKNTIHLILGEDGSLLYNITRDNTILVPNSAIGVNSSDEGHTFTDCLTFVEVISNKINETYNLPTGKVKVYHNKCNEKIYKFKNKNGNIINIECRAYNDGIAFRYTFDKEGDITIVSEKTNFNFPANITSWVMDYKDDYEKYYPKRTFSEIQDSVLAYPALLNINDKWILLSEANVFNHPATRLTKKAGDGLLQVAFPEDSFTISNKYESPWRTFIIGDKLATIVESVLVENLNPPSVIEDMSWIEPGIAVFPWWGDYLANSYIDTLKMYVDMAAEMNWQWIEFDVSLVGSPFRTSKLWETTSWLKDFTDYARSKGIKVYGWDEIEVLKTKEGRDHVYGKYRNLGIQGIKIDYLNSDKLYAMQFREDAMKDAIDYGLLVSFHGETMPRGQHRKYPNLMTLEAVKGAEYYTFVDTPPTPEHNCTLPFTRNVLGSMDYTPVTFTRRKENPRITTYAHELALPFIFESGWVAMADKPKAYLESPAKEVLKKIKCTWDETILIDGYPGEFVCMARRHGNEWHLAAINAGTERTVRVKLDFLNEGTYTFKVYEDDPASPIDNIKIREITASDGQELEFRLIPNGGFCTIIQ
ncbi:glycoside hydrolase family 97 N-terminal domain-containing protein [Dysgonomonas sp. Marseille-P4677]|uniref:glycoside hydrolase family 97 protein n=1 Tax=Dysgonomonas sp. Marseille-P4677 TaxID=2364790 RepID=UPI0019113209|nr:glycoside hydrolase family 97 protein [Dysgonomonas sp. Marseille-P4677]MBK5722642.1 glycoside hydrolase family 97 N-terminal domain-containing protein [Dysgonomonas sp. Marseille-P4677]